jgi:hypothetical protein
MHKPTSEKPDTTHDFSLTNSWPTWCKDQSSVFAIFQGPIYMYSSLETSTSHENQGTSILTTKKARTRSNEASATTNLRTEFLLQLLKQWQDSTIKLAIDKHQHQEKTQKEKRRGKNRRDTQKRKTEETAEEKYRSSGLKGSSPTSETLNKIIWKTLNGIFYIE